MSEHPLLARHYPHGRSASSDSGWPLSDSADGSQAVTRYEALLSW